MKTVLLLLCLLGIACAFSVMKSRYRYFLYRYPFHYPPMKRFQFNSDSSEEGYGGDSSEEEEEEEEEEGGQSNEENAGENEGGKENEEATEAPSEPGTVDKKGVHHAKPPKQVPVRKEPPQKPGKEGGPKKAEKDKAAEKGGKGEEEEDSDENEEEENEEEEEEKVDENGSGVNGTSTNSTAEENGNGGNGEEEEEEEGERNGATTAVPTTLVTTVSPTTEYQDQYETTTEDQWQGRPPLLTHMTPPAKTHGLMIPPLPMVMKMAMRLKQITMGVKTDTLEETLLEHTRMSTAITKVMGMMFMAKITTTINEEKTSKMKTALLCLSLCSLSWAQSEFQAHYKKSKQKCVGEHQKEDNKIVSSATDGADKKHKPRKLSDNLTDAIQETSIGQKHLTGRRDDRKPEDRTSPGRKQNVKEHHGNIRNWDLPQHRLELAVGKENDLARGNAANEIDGSGDIDFPGGVASRHGLTISHEGSDQGKDHQITRDPESGKTDGKSKDGKPTVTKPSKNGTMKIWVKENEVIATQENRKIKGPQSKDYSEVSLKGKANSTNKEPGREAGNALGLSDQEGNLTVRLHSHSRVQSNVSRDLGGKCM
ncbi:hypothetical protein JRQ81_016914 [Phrynocephalus forsythii]|uniref:Integrin-binding sialoprotein n=1 Tax=Phrynocephalus forsythii TaxID=171643 RepID=A0A9Q1B1X5_9SAUR|nr:hypothetical protein JRQ81_016914 [Phrynocephalus forsythii]